MHYIYILYSPTLDKFYIGETQELELRIIQHNSRFFKGASTSIADDWIVRWSFDTGDRIKARKIESFLKKQKSKTFIIRFLLDESLRSSILSKF